MQQSTAKGYEPATLVLVLYHSVVADQSPIEFC